MYNPQQRYTQSLEEASTALVDETKKLRRRRTQRGSGDAVASPPSSLRLYGPRTPVTVTLTYHGGSEPWVRCEYYQGTFWVQGTGSVMDLIARIHAGGFPLSTASRETRRQRAKRSRGSSGSS